MIKIRTWRPLPTSKAGATFYPTTKFLASVYDEDGQWLGDTGKCATREGAAAAGERLAAKVLG
jgi:hypothetical protein